MSTGIFEMISNNENKVKYKPEVLTMAEIENVVKTLIPPRLIQPVLYLNSHGYALFDFALLMNTFFPNIKYWTYTPRLIHNIIYVSLFKKHGLFKLKIYTDRREFKYEFINGTISINKSNNLETIKNIIKLNEQK